MKVIVDTCVWSLALRRNSPSNHSTTSVLRNLIEDSRVQLLGPIRQELLSGIASQEQFIKLKKYLSAFPDLLITTEDYELAAEYSNKCRAKGIQGSLVDFIICAVSVRNDLSIFTVDKDFNAYIKMLPVTLYVE